MWQTLNNIIAIALGWYACITTLTTGIPPHVDTHSPFEDGIISLSLQSQVCPLGTSIFHVECYIQVWALCVASFPYRMKSEAMHHSSSWGVAAWLYCGSLCERSVVFTGSDGLQASWWEEGTCLPAKEESAGHERRVSLFVVTRVSTKLLSYTLLV